MSDKKDKDAEPKKKKGGALMLIIVAVGMLAVGGGGIFALFALGVIGGPHVVIHEDNNPKLIRKGEEDEYAPKAKEGEGGEGGVKEVDGEGGSEYRTIYYSFTEDFTSNLKGTDRLVQASVAASTRRDYRVVMWLKKHELAIRSAILAVLADTPETEVETPEGKDRLQKRMTQAINKVLSDNEGFGGVDAVYFKQFIVQ